MAATSAVPGARGLPLFGETIAFLRNMLTFIDTRVGTYGPMFRTYLFRMPTVFCCSYNTVASILTHASNEIDLDPHVDAAHAYNQFLGPLYPKPNLLLTADNSPLRTRQLHLLNACLQNCDRFQRCTTNLTSRTIKFLTREARKSKNRITYVQLYATFKPLTERVVTEAVLGGLERGKYDHVRNLCSDHFNGVAAVPVSVAAFGARSARAQALVAYKKLTALLHELVLTRLHNLNGEAESAIDVLAMMIRNGEGSIEDGVQVLLTLLSTAVAKAVSSTTTMALALLTEREHCGLQNRIAEEMKEGKFVELDCVLMETLRLHPPLVGGIRSARKCTVICERRVEEGANIWYSYMHANRDKKIYENAERFMTERWKQGVEMKRENGGCPFARAGEEEKIPLSFGAGKRHCKGRDLAWIMMREFVGRSVESFEISGEGVKSKELRYLPVMRPVKDERFGFRLRSSSET